MALCDDPSKLGIINSVTCGLSDVWGTVLGGTVGEVGGVVRGGQDSVVAIAETAGDTADDVSGNVAEAANFGNLLGGGLGLGLGGVVGVVGVGLVAGFAADQLLAGGAGTAALISRASKRRRK